MSSLTTDVSLRESLFFLYVFDRANKHLNHVCHLQLMGVVLACCLAGAIRRGYNTV